MAEVGGEKERCVVQDTMKRVAQLVTQKGLQTPKRIAESMRVLQVETVEKQSVRKRTNRTHHVVLFQLYLSPKSSNLRLEITFLHGGGVRWRLPHQLSKDEMALFKLFVSPKTRKICEAARAQGNEQIVLQKTTAHRTARYIFCSTVHSITTWKLLSLAYSELAFAFENNL